MNRLFADEVDRVCSKGEEKKPAVVFSQKLMKYDVSSVSELLIINSLHHHRIANRWIDPFSITLLKSFLNKNMRCVL